MQPGVVPDKFSERSNFKELCEGWEAKLKAEDIETKGELMQMAERWGWTFMFMRMLSTQLC